MKISGIYQIQSISKPERIYVGSSVDINKRWLQHLSDLKLNKHRSPKLQRHYNKYGKNDLVFEVIESGDYVCNQHLLAREQGWFDRYKYKGIEMPYFNTCLIAGNSAGVIPSQESRQKNRDAHIGNIPWNKGKHIGSGSSTSFKKGMTPWNKNKKATPEARLHQSESHKGKKPWMEGRYHNEETKQKMREAKLGTHQSEEHKRKKSLALMGNKNRLGSKPSNETRKKISDSIKNFHMKLKQKQLIT